MAEDGVWELVCAPGDGPAPEVCHFCIASTLLCLELCIFCDSWSTDCLWIDCSCFSRVFLRSCSFYLRAIGNQGLKLGRKLLYSFLPFSFGLRRVGRLALRLNDAAVRQGFFPFGYFLLLFIHCFLSLNQCFLACIQLRFALRKLRFGGRILLFAGANHRKSDECRKKQRFFHMRRSSLTRGKKMER